MPAFSYNWQRFRTGENSSGITGTKSCVREKGLLVSYGSLEVKP
jgi:hypothetical protein